MAVGTNLYAPFDGTMRFRVAGNGGWTATITASDPRLQGLVVELMHLSGVVDLQLGQSRSVVEGDHVAESGGAKGHPGAGNSTGPHLHGHAILHGKRIPLTSAVKWANEQIKPQRKRNMTTRFVQIGTGGNNFGVGAVCALAGDAGFPGPANWQEYTRTHADGSVNDRAAREFAVHGPAVPITKAEWERLKRDYTTGATAGGATPDQIAKAVNDDAARRMSS